MVINDSSVLSIESPNFKIQTFTITYEKDISNKGKNILQSFKIKPYYYVIDDITYLLKSNPKECECFLQILNSTVISLQNNFKINFFDVFIYEIKINEITKFNKFNEVLIKPSKNSNEITIKLAYQIKAIDKTVELTW